MQVQYELGRVELALSSPCWATAFLASNMHEFGHILPKTWSTIFFFHNQMIVHTFPDWFCAYFPKRRNSRYVVWLGYHKIVTPVVITGSCRRLLFTLSLYSKLAQRDIRSLFGKTSDRDDENIESLWLPQQAEKRKQQQHDYETKKMKTRSSRQMIVLSRQTSRAQLHHEKYESYHDMVLLLSPFSNFTFKELGVQLNNTPVSILHESIAGRYWPVRVADGPITARYRLM